MNCMCGHGEWCANCTPGARGPFKHNISNPLLPPCGCEDCRVERRLLLIKEDLANLTRWARDACALLSEFHRAAPFGSGKRAGELVNVLPVLR